VKWAGTCLRFKWIHDVNCLHYYAWALCFHPCLHWVKYHEL